MKKNTKALLMALCAVLLVVSSVFGTLAYLTDSDEVENTFTVGNVAIKLDEAPVNADGEETAGDRVQANNYKLLPGHEYDKDPMVTVENGSEDCWVFVKVENNIANIEDETNTIAAQMTAKGWTAVADGIYAYKETLSAGDTAVVFETFKISGDVDNEALAAYAGKTIVVTAYAIQADGFDTAEAAWIAAGAEAQA